MFRMAKQEKGEKGENAKYKRDQGEWGIRSKLATGLRGGTAKGKQPLQGHSGSLDADLWILHWQLKASLGGFTAKHEF